jgi:hypothetical protein
MTESGSRVSLPPHPVGVLLPLSRDRHRSGGPGESHPRAPTESVRNSLPLHERALEAYDAGGAASAPAMTSRSSTSPSRLRPPRG